MFRTLCTPKYFDLRVKRFEHSQIVYETGSGHQKCNNEEPLNKLSIRTATEIKQVEVVNDLK